MEENHNHLHITSEAKEFLREIAKWASFLSIVGFVMIGLLVLVAFFAGSLMSSIGSMGGGEMGAAGAIGGTFITVMYLLIALLYFFPIFYLYKFASNLKGALAQDNSEVLSTSLGYLKSHYKFLGILTIIGLAIYALIFVFMIIGFAAM